MNPYLVIALESTPNLLQRAIARVPVGALDRPTHPDRFSPHEVICHLADWESILREERLKGAVNQPGSTVNAYDEGDRARDLNYAGMDLNEQLERFAAERAKTVAYVKLLSQDELDRSIVHPERGTQTAFAIANMMVCHDVYHFQQLLDVIPLK